MVTESVQRPFPAEAEVPLRIVEALDRSTDDLRHDRVEDSADFLARMQAGIDAYKTRKQEPTTAAAKP